MENLSSASLMEKSSEDSRSLLFGLLVNCIFSGVVNGNCPLSQLRESLSFEEKYKFVMKLSREEVFSVLDLHEECSKKECFLQCGAEGRESYVY